MNDPIVTWCFCWGINLRRVDMEHGFSYVFFSPLLAFWLASAVYLAYLNPKGTGSL